MLSPHHSIADRFPVLPRVGSHWYHPTTGETRTVTLVKCPAHNCPDEMCFVWWWDNHDKVATYAQWCTWASRATPLPEEKV